jgi:hypothetical protein
MGSKHASEPNVYIQKGEGGAGLDASIDLDELKQLTLAMMGCQNKGAHVALHLGLYTGKKIPPELEKLARIVLFIRL